MRGAAPDEPQDGAHNTDPEKKRDFSDGSDAAIEQDHEQNHQGAGDSFLSILAKRAEAGGVLGKTEGARSATQRPLDPRLPDEKEKHHAAQPPAPVRFPNTNVTSP